MNNTGTGAHFGKHWIRTLFLISIYEQKSEKVDILYIKLLQYIVAISTSKQNKDKNILYRP